MMGHGSPITDSGKPISIHGSNSPEAMRSNLVKSRTSQLQYPSPQDMHQHPYSPTTNPSSATYSNASPNGTENFGFKRSNSDHIPRNHDSANTSGNRPQRHASFGISDARPVEFSRSGGPPLQTNVGSYGLLSSAAGNQNYHTQASPQNYVSQQNFPPFSLPPPSFNTASSTASTRESEPPYPTSMSTDYPSDGIHQQSGVDAMNLDQMSAPNTMPVFGGEGYNRSPFAIPEDFVAYLFSNQQIDGTSPIGQMSQPGYANYPDAQNQYYAPYFANDMNLGGFFPPSQQPLHPMAVTNLLDTTLPETILSEEKSQAIIDLIKDRFNETDHAPVARQKGALLEGDRTEDSHMMSRKMMQTYIGSYWYHFSEQVPIRKLHH